ncbi:MAG: hypothetical protein LBD23_01055 [Oscillospiraceae bacterium]|nr:hypothetical protein [Oscillospiraceae bacterium]
MKAGEVINLTDLSDAIKKDKQAAQPPAKKSAEQTAPPPTARTNPQKSQQPTIKEQIAAGRNQLAGGKPPAPQRAAANNKNTGLE